MNRITAFRVVFVLLQIHCVICLIEPISLSIVGAGILAYGYKKIFLKCDYEECCDVNWVPMNISDLHDKLKKNLHGQQIAHKTIVGALQGYTKNASPPKALAMSFHGLPGSGKNFVAKMIAESFFKKGTSSDYYHFFNGRTIAPDKNRVQDYQEQIKKTIVKSLSNCERSMFVFDEVDMMPEGLLNVLVPFLDYVHETSVEIGGERKHVQTNKAIYIFLSNTGSLQIMQRMIKFWTEGVDRNTRTLQDFEHLISIGAFNEKGGFQRSDTIRSHVIDHYVPFLPLEEEHVKSCMRDAFRHRIVEDPTREMEEEVLSVVSYGPEPHNIYSKSGCKKIEQKVISVVYRSQHFDF